jgi:hypothetical protein
MVESLDAHRGWRTASASSSTGNANPARPSGGKTLDNRKLFPLVGAAFGAGVVLAKIIDWRGHAHPRG